MFPKTISKRKERSILTKKITQGRKLVEKALRTSTSEASLKCFESFSTKSLLSHCLVFPAAPLDTLKVSFSLSKATYYLCKVNDADGCFKSNTDSTPLTKQNTHMYRHKSTEVCVKYISKILINTSVH